MPLPFDIKRLLRTPGFSEDEEGAYTDPASNALPEAPHRRVSPPAPSGIPGGMGMPESDPIGPAPIKTRRHRIADAREEYLGKTPGRGKSALLGAARGFLGGGGLAGAITGGAYGAIDPRGLREMEFEQRVQPKILRGFGLEDAETQAARQTEEAALDAEYKRAQTGAMNRSNQPAPPRPPSYSSASGLGIFNTQTGQVTTPAPAEQPKTPAPHWVRNEKGQFTNLNAPENQGKPIKGYDRPRAARQPKGPKEDIQTIPISEVRRIAEEQNTTVDRVKARLVAKRIKVVE